MDPIEPIASPEKENQVEEQKAEAPVNSSPSLVSLEDIHISNDMQAPKNKFQKGIMRKRQRKAAMKANEDAASNGEAGEDPHEGDGATSGAQADGGGKDPVSTSKDQSADEIPAANETVTEEPLTEGVSAGEENVPEEASTGEENATQEAPAAEENATEESPATEETAIEKAPAAEENVPEEASTGEENATQKAPAAEGTAIEEAIAAGEN